jgi:hypothetical protein
MARCYQLTSEQSREWDAGGWLSLAIQEDILDWAERERIHKPVVVVMADYRIAFALTEGRELA